MRFKNFMAIQGIKFQPNIFNCIYVENESNSPPKIILLHISTCMYVPVLFEVIPFDIDFSFHLKWITVYGVHNEGLFEWFTEVNNTLSSKAKQTTKQTTKQSNYTKYPNKQTKIFQLF